MYKILFSCGDRSADKYLSELLKSITFLNPDVKKIVLGGELTKPYSDTFVEDVVSYDVHGFFFSFIQIRKLIQLLKKVDNILKEEKVNLVVLIDFYGFNIKLAQRAKKYNIPVMYYITPQVWATRKYRIKKIKNYVDYVINIYPFEQEIYKSYNINAEYLGHPIVDLIKPFPSQHKIGDENILIGIFPGSRSQVVRWNLPVMLDVAKVYTENYNTKNIKFVIFGFEKYKNLYNRIIDKKISNRQFIEICYNNEYRDKISFAISVSGTVVIENVLYKIPTIVIYKLPTFMYLIIKSLISVKYISIPNIILNRTTIPEFIQKDININKICEYIHSILTDAKKYNDIVEEYKNLHSLFSKENKKPVSLQVAEKILQILKNETD